MLQGLSLPGTTTSEYAERTIPPYYTPTRTFQAKKEEGQTRKDSQSDTAVTNFHVAVSIVQLGLAVEKTSDRGVAACVEECKAECRCFRECCSSCRRLVQRE